MRRVLTKTFYRFLMAFLIMIAISCSLLIASADAANKGQASAVWEGMRQVIGF